jgi:phospholipid transport system transporter-binding protein
MAEPGAGTAVTITQSAPNRFTVRGPLTFTTAPGALRQGLEAFAAASGPLEVDCAQVGASDSAGLAVLVEWLGWARRAGRQLRYANIPETICAIARISEIEGLLESADGTAARAAP